MFYCTPCGNERNWPTCYTSVSRGNCELCGTDGIQHDVQSKSLLGAPTNPQPDEIERVARVADKIADAIAEQAQPVMQLEDANAIDKAVAELTRLREQIAAKDEALEACEVTLRLDRERMAAKGMATAQNEETYRVVRAALTNTPIGGEG